ncbi:MAG: FG-GAP-like repeat-containing protein, partial [Planctomycetota bacterium]
MLAASLWAAPAVAAQLATPVDLTTTINGPALLPPADVDGDGDLDVLVTDAIGEALRWVQRTPSGPGPLLPLLRAPGGEALWRLADLDGDGDLDALALRRSPAQLHVFEHHQGAFLPARREAAFPGAAVDLEVGDLDRDGVADVLVVL